MSEKEIQKAIIEALEAHPKVAIVIKTDNDRVRNRKYRNGKSGLPDIFGVLLGGRSFFMEVKTSTGIVSEEQKAFLLRVKEANAVGEVIRSVEQALEVIERG